MCERPPSSSFDSGASSDISPWPSRFSMSMTSRSGTLSASASAADDVSKPSASSLSFSLRRLKNSLRCAWVVPILTSRQLFKMNLQDVRADPPRRVRRQLHAAIGIVLLHRLHEADVALLHQVEQVAVRAPVLVRDLDHQPQVRGDQAARGVHVAGLGVLDGELVLLLAREQRVAADFVDVYLQRIAAAERAAAHRRERLVGRHQRVFVVRFARFAPVAPVDDRQLAVGRDLVVELRRIGLGVRVVDHFPVDDLGRLRVFGSRALALTGHGIGSV